MSERQYLSLAKRVLNYGETRTDRTGTGTRSVFGASLEWDLHNKEVALISTKTVAWDKALHELCWMLRGDTSLDGLGPARNIWEPWADALGNLGPVYGKQWRDFQGIDQLENVINLLKERPDTRKAVLSSWNVMDLPWMALEPCPVIYQFSLRGPLLNELELSVYQRSADLFLGVPFDLFEMSVMAHLVARELGVFATRLHWTGGDVHIYKDHVGVMMDQVTRTPRTLPSRLEVRPDAPALLDGRLARKHMEVWDYDPMERLYGKVSV